jgi:predicted Ser/Thr protein kinase
MDNVKDTLRALVRVGYDGRVHKTFRGPSAKERFENEIRVLRFLEERGCPFVPRVLEVHPEELRMVTSSCGGRVDYLDEKRTRELFEELETYGVRHDDADRRNVTYRQSDGRFCLIDFEFAVILPEFAKPGQAGGFTQNEVPTTLEHPDEAKKRQEAESLKNRETGKAGNQETGNF